jgi:DHA2 family multidrug resistance protein
MPNLSATSPSNQRIQPVPATGNTDNDVSLKTWVAVGGSLLGAFMAILDIQITNSAL